MEGIIFFVFVFVLYFILNNFYYRIKEDDPIMKAYKKTDEVAAEKTKKLINSLSDEEIKKNKQQYEQSKLEDEKRKKEIEKESLLRRRTLNEKIAFQEAINRQRDDHRKKAINNKKNNFYVYDASDIELEEAKKIQVIHNEEDPLKKMGNDYERFIGLKFEEKNEVVIYNGFIRGVLDEGVDIISISIKDKTINLIQCKNWLSYTMSASDIGNIYYKMDIYTIDSLYREVEIQQYLKIKLDYSKIEQVLEEIKNHAVDYKVRKTLYISNDSIIEKEAMNLLSILKSNIFKYKDMKVAIYKL